MQLTETPEQLCQRLARIVRDVLRRTDRTALRYAEDIDGLHITIGSKRSTETVDDDPDLPPVLRLARPATRAVYWVLHDLRADLGTEARVMPADIMARQRELDPGGDEPSRDTVNHALSELRAKEVAWSHPRFGWIFGRERASLPGLESVRVPVSAGHSGAAPRAPEPGYASGTACDSRTRTAGARAMTRTHIWVPTEDSDNGLVVVDAVTEMVHPATDRIGKVTYETRTGRTRTVAAVRAELLRVEDRYAVVRLPGDSEVRTRVLGEWQLRGLTSPEPTSASA